MRFLEWLKLREMTQMAQPSMQNSTPNGAMNAKKPMLGGRDKTVDNIKNILKKSSDPKSAGTIKQISQIYDTEMDKSSDGGEIASIASKKSTVLSSLLKK